MPSLMYLCILGLMRNFGDQRYLMIICYASAVRIVVVVDVVTGVVC